MDIKAVAFAVQSILARTEFGNLISAGRGQVKDAQDKPAGLPES
jgi:hypothetical protein